VLLPVRSVWGDGDKPPPMLSVVAAFCRGSSKTGNDLPTGPRLAPIDRALTDHTPVLSTKSRREPPWLLDITSKPRRQRRVE